MGSGTWSQSHRDLGRLLSEAEQHEEAIEHFERVVQLSPTTNNLFNLAIASAAGMRLNEAQATFKQILASHPDHEQTLHRLGNLELEMGHKEAAIDYLWQAIQSRPDNVMASYDLANIYKFYGEFEDATGLYQSIIRIEPRNADEQAARADSLYQIAAIEVARGNTEQAEQLLAQLLKLVPDHPKAHYTRGQALMQLGMTHEAQLEFERHVELLAQRPVTSGME
jgi:tetratricopeptide (TPR) repeat protein